MIIHFNKNGNLEKNQTLTYVEFEKVFGFNESRKEKIEKALRFFKILKLLGCSTVYITGSFVSTKDFPNDIDLCVDDTGLDYVGFIKEYPEFLQPKGIDRIRQEYKVHFVLFFNKDCKEFLDRFKKDRDGNPRGFVKIYINNIDT
jgi:hypothetical protein